MYYFYVLWSNKLNKFYYGYTSDLINRFASHNKGKDRSFTFDGRPWKLVYYEAYLSKNDACKRETSVKNRGNVISFIKKRIEESLNVARERA